jgi:hypothetical protein
MKKNKVIGFKKRTRQGGKIKTSSMNKSQKVSHKK